MLLRIYPRAWRERYGDEFEALLLGNPGDLHTLADVLSTALGERLNPTMEIVMAENSGSIFALTRKPSALIALAMSLAALATVLTHVAIYGVIHEADEGAAAHIWQLLIAGHLPIAAWFAIKWLPRARKQALVVLALLGLSIGMNVAAVYFLT